MPFIVTTDLPEIERLPGWRGRYFNSQTMTFAHYDFDAGAVIHAHDHAQEEVWHVVDGEMDVTIAGETWRAGPGSVAIIPPNTPHTVTAITSGKAIVADYPVRKMV